MERMTDNLTLVNTLPTGQVVRKDGYQSETLREIRARASKLSTLDSTEERLSLRRLNEVLDKDQPPGGDVPRGFYLNIEV